MNARLIAAPRVPRRALWQRSASRTRSRLGLSRTTSPARRAERAASLPCPRPSIAATSAPSGRSLTTARSPLVASPRRHLVATLHSTGSHTVRSGTPAAVLVTERRLDVADARPIVAGDYDEAVAVGFLERPEDDLATADVHDDVACDLRNGSGDQGGIRSGEAEPFGHGSSL